MTDVNNWVKDRRPIVYRLNADIDIDIDIDNLYL